MFHVSPWTATISGFVNQGFRFANGSITSLSVSSGSPVLAKAVKASTSMPREKWSP
jgi:hypothetical protein